jgi:hypothetical protein
MSDDIPSVAEAMAEIRRLRSRVAELEKTIEYVNQGNDAFQARNVQLEAAMAALTGTLEPPTDDEPARYTHHVPPSAPPHNERPPIGNDDE